MQTHPQTSLNKAWPNDIRWQGSTRDWAPSAAPHSTVGWRLSSQADTQRHVGARVRALWMKDRRRRRRRRWLVMMLLMGRPRAGTSSSLQLCSLWTHSFMKFAFAYCCCAFCVCVCVFVISPRNKIVCKPGRVLFIAIVVACCRSSCCSCCLCCCLLLLP